jgi:DNA-binding IclR family transcriptional regulator
VLDLLGAFSKDRHTLSSRELSELTGIALPTVYRYLALLRDAGFVVGDDRGCYHLSVRVIALAQAAEAADDLIGFADPVMRELAAETGETVLLVRLVADAAVCVHRIESSHRLRLAYEPGQPVSLEHGASARLLLGSMPATSRRILLDRMRERDSAAANRLEREVALAQERGWAVSQEELDPGIWAASAAVRDAGGRVLAVVSIPSPLVRTPERTRERLLRQVRDAAERIGEDVRRGAR